MLIAKRSASTKKLPVVFFLHGTGGSADGVKQHLEQYAKLGFLAVGVDTRYHGSRGGMAEYNAALIEAWRGSG